MIPSILAHRRCVGLGSRTHDLVQATSRRSHRVRALRLMPTKLSCLVAGGGESPL